ncbi:nucleoside/nucleotide kinase family protein [Micromonospora sp. SL1-18]|uniref:nucleoside/nucleotide kinase family protein n=1 Tax=Micromonospora sp. SL1-18 TaxID=3399128 RepID=UPI003A4DC70E
MADTPVVEVRGEAHRPAAVAAQVLPLGELVARARALAAAGPRQLLGIAGAPGAGKSTLAERIVAEVGPAARLVPMDGFHLAQSELVRLGRAERKGAPDTFDANGFVSMLRRLHQLEPASVWAPVFRRDLEEPVAGAIEVPPEVRLLVTEGNYLLLRDEPWDEVRSLLHQVWFLDLDAELRLRRLTARHEAYGKTPEQARAWALGSDEANAARVAGTADRADLVFRLADPLPG